MSLMKRRGRPKKSKTIQKESAAFLAKPKGPQELACSECGRLELASAEASSVICAICTQKMILDPLSLSGKAPVPEGEKRKRGRPRKSLAPSAPQEKVVKSKRPPAPTVSGKNPGWPRCWWIKKEFVGPDGVTYYKGKPATV